MHVYTCIHLDLSTSMCVHTHTYVMLHTTSINWNAIVTNTLHFSAFFCLAHRRSGTLQRNSKNIPSLWCTLQHSATPCNTFSRCNTLQYILRHTLQHALHHECNTHCNMHCNTHSNKLERRQDSGCCSVCCVCTHAYCRFLQCMLHVTGHVCDTLQHKYAHTCLYIYIYMYT